MDINTSALYGKNMSDNHLISMFDASKEKQLEKQIMALEC